MKRFNSWYLPITRDFWCCWFWHCIRKRYMKGTFYDYFWSSLFISTFFLSVFIIWRKVRISLWVFSITMFLWLESVTPFIGNVLNKNIEVEFWEFVYELYRFFNSKIKDYFEETANPRFEWNIKIRWLLLKPQTWTFFLIWFPKINYCQQLNWNKQKNEVGNSNCWCHQHIKTFLTISDS